MTAPIFFLSAAVAGVLVLVLTWRKAGIGAPSWPPPSPTGGRRRRRHGRRGAADQARTSAMPFRPANCWPPSHGVFIAASWSNRRYHALKLQQEQAQKRA